MAASSARFLSNSFWNLNVANCFCFVLTLIIGRRPSRRPSFVTWMQGNTKPRNLVSIQRSALFYMFKKFRAVSQEKETGEKTLYVRVFVKCAGLSVVDVKLFFSPFLKKFKKLRARISKDIRRVGKPNAIPSALSTVVGIFSNEWTSQQRWPHPFLSFFFFLIRSIGCVNSKRSCQNISSP